MDEARKFLRYVLPGLVAAMELLAMFAICYGKVFVGPLADMNSESALGTAVVTLVAAGPLGYVLLMIHDLAQQCFACLRRDYPGMIAQLQSERLLEVQVVRSNEKPRPARCNEKLCSDGAWRSDQLLMAPLLCKGELGKEVHESSVGMSHQFAASGATLWGFVSVLLVFWAHFFLYAPRCQCGSGTNLTLVVLFSLAFLGIHLWHTRNLRNRTVEFDAAAIRMLLPPGAFNAPLPLQLSISDKELERRC